MAGPKVLILYEDKTGGGLHRPVDTIVKTRRAEAGHEPLAYFRPLAMKSNTKLIEQCASFGLMRFHGPHHADHVVAVIDAYRAEDVVPGAPGPPNQATREDPAAFDRYCATLDESVMTHLNNLAFEGMAQDIRSREETRFHPCVLFWERESVFLAGAEVLRRTRRLVIPEELTSTEGISRTRCPTFVIEQAWKAARGSAYSKQITGPGLFGDLSAAYDDWAGILDRMPSLRKTVDLLIGL